MVPTAAGTPNLTLFRQGVTKLLDVFHDASREEKALQGAAKDSAARSNMAKRSADAASLASSSEDDVRRMFFYPKFLTSKNLLDLEVADSSFRKQVLVQCLILFRFLHSFTDAAKVKQQASLTHPNRLFLAAGYRLSEADDRWISDLEARTYTEISRTPTDGEYFVKTVKMVLQNERNWVRSLHLSS
jgi:phosphorylcholine metabolism protein LicD